MGLICLDWIVHAYYIPNGTNEQNFITKYASIQTVYMHKLQYLVSMTCFGSINIVFADITCQLPLWYGRVKQDVCWRSLARCKCGVGIRWICQQRNKYDDIFYLEGKVLKHSIWQWKMFNCHPNMKIQTDHHPKKHNQLLRYRPK